MEMKIMNYKKREKILYIVHTKQN